MLILIKKGILIIFLEFKNLFTNNEKNELLVIS